MKKMKQKVYIYLFMMIFLVYPINGQQMKKNVRGISREKGKGLNSKSTIAYKDESSSPVHQLKRLAGCTSSDCPDNQYCHRGSRCSPKKRDGEEHFNLYPAKDSCESGEATCSRCGTSTSRSIPDGGMCSSNTNCASNWCMGTTNYVDCHGKCEPHFCNTVVGECTDVRFSQKLKQMGKDVHITEILGASKYPANSKLLSEFLVSTTAVSVVTEKDCEYLNILSESTMVELIEGIGGLPSHAPEQKYWIELEEVVSLQKLRLSKGHLRADEVIPWFPLPNLWKDYSMNAVAEVVRADFPGNLNVQLIQELLSSDDSLQVDNDLINKRCNGQFLHTQVMLADMNTWSVGLVAPVNFRAKWYAGRARPEEVAFKIKHGVCDTEAPECLVHAVKSMPFECMESFTAYANGAPNHPSWPAMHSAAASISMWLPVLFNLTPAQVEATKIQDLAISMARSVAGVHYKGDNIVGLKMGQEVLAKELPEYLEKKYCADREKVSEKIKKVKFNWDAESERLLDGYDKKHHDICSPDTKPDLLWAKLYGRGSFAGGAKPELWAKIGKGSYIKRICESCSKSTHKLIIYKRLTPKGQIDFSKLFLSDWFSKPSSDAENAIKKDFNLYSTFKDAKNDVSQWSFCNYNDGGIGFPRDCGPTGYVGSEWNSMTRGGETDFAYYLYTGE